jgi:hypothetical protein
MDSSAIVSSKDNNMEILVSAQITGDNRGSAMHIMNNETQLNGTLR